MPSQLVFFSRCKPQGVDALSVALEAKRIFIGYPLHRADAPYNPRHLRSCVIDLSCNDDEWHVARNGLKWLPQYTQNRNLVRSVAVGSIALIPRPSLGVVYCGRVTNVFELIDSPPWYDEYLQIRRDQGHKEEDGEETWHAADVAQSWKVDEFRPIPVPRIPAWIRRSMFGRSTYGIIRLQEGIAEDPYAIMSTILEHHGFQTRGWSEEPAVVEQRLMEDLNPSSFEHLVVSLLQLEYPTQAWTQVGGSGDGGVDGVGADQEGNVAGLLQCKWQYWGGDQFDSSIWKGKVPFPTYLAALFYPKGIQPPLTSIFWDRRYIAGLVIKHHRRLPQAMAMRIGREG